MMAGGFDEAFGALVLVYMIAGMLWLWRQS